MQTSGFFDASYYVVRGWRLVRTPGLRRFVWIPLAVNVLVFTGLGWIMYSAFVDWMDSFSLLERYSETWLIGSLITLLQFIAGLIVALGLAYAFTLLANLIGAPFNGLLAERVEAHLTGRSAAAEPTFAFLLKSVPKTLWSEIAKLTYLAIWLIPLIIAHFVPGLNLIAPLLLLLFGAWMFALEYIDYPMGNHGHRFGDVKRALKRKRGTAIGFGLAVAVLSAIPVVNLIVMPIAVAGATALYIERIA